MIPLYLNKIKSDKKALELAGILEAVHPTHMPKVLNIIREHNHWCDYNINTTAYQIGTVYHQCPQQTQNRAIPRPRKWDLTPTEILRIRYQRSVALSKILCEENKEKNFSFPHPERLACASLNPSAEFLRK
jgi:hypothetical protein